MQNSGICGANALETSLSCIKFYVSFCTSLLKSNANKLLVHNYVIKIHDK